MSIFSKVTLESLRKNRLRTVVTIIGIILSAAMICAVTTFASSIQNYALQNAIYYGGNWHGKTSGVDFNEYEKLLEEEALETVYYAQRLGYAKVDSKNEYKPYLYVLGADEEFRASMPLHITDGRLPEKEGEIILPDHLAENGELVYKLGDSLTLGLGERIREDFVLGQDNPCFGYDENGESFLLEEEIIERETITYTVVGFYERPEFEGYSAPGYTAITIADKDAKGEFKYDIYFRMNNPKELYSFMEDNKIDGGSNRDVLMFSGASGHAGFYTVLYGLAGVVIALIMFGSISLIYNAFSISVSERTKQFGLLSSVGATRKQLRKMVFFEALVVSAIGIPLGIIAGVGGIGVTLYLIGDMISEIESVQLTLCVSGGSIIAAAIISLITVLISAWIPSKRATRVSAIEAIRQNTDIKAKPKEVKTAKLVYKLFGFPGMLANKHYKRNRKKYRTTVVSLFMSIVLFVSASTFTNYLTQSVEGSFGTLGYDLVYYCYSEEREKLQGEEAEFLSEIKAAKAVSEAAITSTVGLRTEVSKEWLREEMLTLAESSGYVGEAEDTDKIELYIGLCFVDDDSYKQVLKDNNLSEDKYMNPKQPLGITMDMPVTSFDDKTDKMTTTKVLSDKAPEEFKLSGTTLKQIEGYEFSEYVFDEDYNIIGVIYRNIDDYEDILELTPEEAESPYEIETGAMLEKTPYFIDGESGLTIIYPRSFMDKVIEGAEIAGFGLNYFIKSDNHSESYTAVKKLVADKGLITDRLYNYAEQVEESRNTVTIIKVFAYGFIILISLIAAANVFNTISTNLNLRRREFAMLKSVGLTNKGINRMMNFECVLYGTKSLLFGLPVSAAISYLIYKIVNEGFSTSFSLPWSAIGIATLSVFVVVFATMMYSMSKIKRDNTIDALKNENL